MASQNRSSLSITSASVKHGAKALATGVLAAALALGAGPALAEDKTSPPGRKLVTHTVQPGETATSLAVEHHAWTAKLIEWNALGPDAQLHVGQRIEIPVVLSALPKKQTPDQRDKTGKKKRNKHADPSRERVRQVIKRTADEHGVGTNLALAIAWQESGWQMHHVSRANAIGAMQVLPTTGAWMSLYAGRDLKLRKTRDNVLAGVLLLKHLGDETRSTHRQIAAYYQGLGAVREHGLYDDTKRYVRNVQAIRRSLKQGNSPY